MGQYCWMKKNDILICLNTFYPQLPGLVCWLLVKDPSMFVRMVITREGFFFYFTCCLDAAQTHALAKDQSVDNPSQDHLKVNPVLGGFFCRTELPFSVPVHGGLPELLTCLTGRLLPSSEVLGSPQTRDRVTILCLTEFHSLCVCFRGVPLLVLSHTSLLC